MKIKRMLTALILGLGLASAFSMLIGQAAPSNPIANPAPNSHTAPSTTTVSITYDEPMSTTTVASRTLVVQAKQGGLVTGIYSLENEGKTVVLVPDAPFHPGELVHATATTATLSITGEHPAAPTVWQFRTAVTGGSGYLTPHPTAPTFGAGESSYGITTGDVDGDGDLDAVVANFSDQAETVYLNDGTGQFTAHPISPTFGSRSSTAVALGDVDSDGDLDALVANGAAPQDVYLNNGLGCFAPHPISPTFGAGESVAIELGDVDGDGDLDAVVANWQAAQDVYLNDGTGRFAPHPISPTFGFDLSFDIAMGDVDGDGDLDAVTANYYDQAQAIYLNDGTGRFAAHPISPTFGAGYSNDIALGDLDGDGDLDAVVANYDDQAEDVYLNDGTGRFTAHPDSPTFGAGRSSTVALGDLDGDGDLDAIVSNAEGQAEDVYLNDGTGCFATHRTFGGGNSLDIVLGDVDGDGNLDALVANFGAPHTVWLNQDFVVYLPLVTRD
jgi:hypothetical protein